MRGRVDGARLAGADDVGLYTSQDFEVEVKRLTDGELLNMNYRLRCETGGTGTFSVFRDDFPLRACQLKAFEGAGVTTWCLSTDRALLAAASNRKVQTWRLKYPDK